MSGYCLPETFFRPPEQSREQSALPAAVYNDLQLLLKKNGRARPFAPRSRPSYYRQLEGRRGPHLFVPIRSMQFQAVVESGEIIFVDSQGGYAHQDGVGGRLIRIAWQPPPATERESLHGPVPCRILYYFPGLEETQRRLMSEFPPVLRQLLQRHREQALQTGAPRVLSLRRNG